MSKYRNFHNITRADIIWITVIVIILSVLVGLFVTMSAGAAADCKSRYVVKPYDTLRTVSGKYNLVPWQLIKANRNQTEQPNYPIYLWSSLCIPYPTDEYKKIADTILDQPPAFMFITQKGQSLTISAYGFAKDSNWHIKNGGEKIGKMKMFKKGVTVKTVKTDKGLLTICLKNMTTDFVYCGKVKQVR